jgi:hypothetical protein
LGIGDDQDQEDMCSECFKLPTDRHESLALRKQGYGKFQTYANFLKGDEKEQYEKYLENKRIKKIQREVASRKIRDAGHGVSLPPLNGADFGMEATPQPFGKRGLGL